MNRKVRSAVLRILLLIEDFTPEELAEAASYIEGQAIDDLLAYLSQKSSWLKNRSGTRSGEPGASLHGGETRALQELKLADPEKYQGLLDLETAIREGRALKSLADFRTFGTMLDKSFNPGKNRKEALGRLMSLLAKMDAAAIRAAIDRMPSAAGNENDSFRRLANQLISGHPQRPAESA